MVDGIFFVVRVLIGLLGAFWLLGGMFGAAVAGRDHAWIPAVGALAMALIGFCFAYGAFVRAPWEPRRAPPDQPG